MTCPTAHSTSYDSDLIVHVKNIRNMIRHLQGLDPVPEEGETP